MDAQSADLGSQVAADLVGGSLEFLARPGHYLIGFLPGHLDDTAALDVAFLASLGDKFLALVLRPQQHLVVLVLQRRGLFVLRGGTGQVAGYRRRPIVEHLQNRFPQQKVQDNQ